MDSITVMAHAPVKVVMTPLFRSQVNEQFKNSILEVDKEVARLSDLAKQASDAEVRERISLQIQQLAQQKQGLEWRIRETEAIKEGAEVPYQSLPILRELAVGDDLQKQLSVEVVLKDWKVIELRSPAQ